MKWPRASFLFVAGLVLLAVAIAVVGDPLVLVRQIASLPWWSVALAGAMTLLARCINALVLRAALPPAERQISYPGILRVAYIRGYFNLFFTGAGVAASAWHLKRRHGTPVTAFAAAALPVTILQLSALGLIGLALVPRLPADAASVPILVAVWLAVAIIPFACLWLPVPQRWLPRRVAELARSFNAARRAILVRPSYIAGLALLATLTLIIRLTRFLLVALSIDPSIDPWTALTSAVLGELAVLVNLTPSALGLRELLISVGAALAQGDVSTLLAAAVADRVITTLVALVGGQYALWRSHHDDRAAR